jgi:alpha-beta hydrolase superfamily lysophospholipase
MKHLPLLLIALVLASCANVSNCKLPPGVKPFPHCQKAPFAHEWTGCDGTKLPYLKALPKSGKPKAVVILVTGLDGVTGDYASITQELTRHGYAVYGIENRSTVYGPKKEQGNPSDWHPWVKDFLGFQGKVRTFHPGLPVFWHGHSFGAVTALAALHDLSKTEMPQGLILHSPAYTLMQKSNVFEAALGRAFGWVRLPHITLMEAGDIRITEDLIWDCQWKGSEDRVRAGIAVRFVTQARKMGRVSAAQLQNLPVPTLAMWGRLDKIAPGLASNDEFDQFMKSTLGGAAVTRVSFKPGGHILNEGPTKHEALATIISWLDKQ